MHNVRAPSGEVGRRRSEVGRREAEVGSLDAYPLDSLSLPPASRRGDGGGEVAAVVDEAVGIHTPGVCLIDSEFPSQELTQRFLVNIPDAAFGLGILDERQSFPERELLERHPLPIRLPVNL